MRSIEAELQRVWENDPGYPCALCIVRAMCNDVCDEWDIWWAQKLSTARSYGRR